MTNHHIHHDPAVRALVARERAAALREAADDIETTMGPVWGDTAWLTTGPHVASLMAGLLREYAEDPR